MATLRIRPTGLVARDDEVGRLIDALEALTRGRGSVALVRGDAGVGKSALLALMKDRADHRGVRVATGAAVELGSERPFGALADALALAPGSADPARAEVGRLLTGARPGEPDGRADLRFVIADAIIELLHAESSAGPLVLALDDLQWADTSTLFTILRIGHLTPQLPVLLVLAHRTFPRPPHLLQLIDRLERQGATRIQLGPLDSSALQTLSERALGAPPGEALRQQLDATGGNPLFAQELLTTLVAEGALLLFDDRIEMAGADLPRSVSQTVLRRIGYLGPSVLDLLRVASVLGRSFTVAELAAVAGTPAVDVVRLLLQAHGSGLIVEDGDRSMFRHDLVRDAIYGELPRAARRALHLHAARTLAAAGSPALQIATQFALAEPTGDVEAIGWLRAAANEAMARDPVSAVSLLETARQLAVDPSQRVDVEAALVTALTWAGRGNDAVTVGRELLPRIGDRATESRIRMAIADALFLQNRMREAADECATASELEGLEPVSRAIITGRLAAARLWADDLDGGQAAAREAQELGAATGSLLARCLGWTNAGWVAFLRGRPAEGIAECRRSVEVVDLSVDPALKRSMMAHSSLAFLLLEADEPSEAELVLERGRQIGAMVGRTWDLPLYHNYRALSRYLSGRWHDAVAELEATLTVADDVGNGRGTGFACALLAVIASHRGNLHGAGVHLTAADRYAQRWGMLNIERCYVAWARASVYEADGRPARALEVLEESWRNSDELGILAMRHYLGPALVRLALDVGRRTLAEEVAVGIRAYADLSGVPSAIAAALLTEALVTDDRDLLQEAVTAHRATWRSVSTAQAEEAAGRCLLESGFGEQSRPLIDAALGTYDRLGASHDAARVRALLRSHGVRLGARGKRDRPKTGLDALTPTEAEVANLVAQGLSNPQIAARLFISRHTVESHVSHILSKLGCASRVEIATAWTERRSAESRVRRAAPVRDGAA